MKISPNTIITLENNEKYVILNETTYEGETYFLVMGLDENKEIVQSNVAIFQEEYQDADIYVTRVEDPNLIIELTKILKTQL